MTNMMNSLDMQHLKPIPKQLLIFSNFFLLLLFLLGWGLGGHILRRIEIYDLGVKIMK